MAADATDRFRSCSATGSRDKREVEAGRVAADRSAVEEDRSVVEGDRLVVEGDKWVAEGGRREADMKVEVESALEVAVSAWQRLCNPRCTDSRRRLVSEI